MAGPWLVLPRRPAHLMDDGKHGILNGGRNLFSDFSEVAERIGGE